MPSTLRSKAAAAAEKCVAHLLARSHFDVTLRRCWRARRSSQIANVALAAALDGSLWRSRLVDLCPRATDADMTIVALQPVPASDSGHVHLIGVTARGSASALSRRPNAAF